MCHNIDRITERKTSLNLFILDCCREFKYTSSLRADELTRSLAVEQANWTCLAYSCGPNAKASDGKKKGHGKHTGEFNLLQHMFLSWSCFIYN